MLYQLSYSRRFTMLRTRRCFYCNGLSQNGGEGNRTPDLVNAIHALSQLSYSPRARRNLPPRYTAVKTQCVDGVRARELGRAMVRPAFKASAV